MTGKANDWRNQQHVVLDFPQTSKWARLTCHFSKIINEGDHSAYTVGYTMYTMPKQKTHGALQKGKRDFVSIRDRWENDSQNKETQMTHGWTYAWVRFLDHIAKLDISHAATAEQRGRYQNLLYLRAFGKDLNGPLSASRPRYQEAENVLKGMQEQWQKNVGIEFIPPSARKRLNDELPPDTKGFLQWPQYELG